MTKRFGPTLGAGTVIIEKDAGKTIQPAPTGTTVFVGQFEKGEVDQLLPTLTQRQFIKLCGTYFAGSEAPDNAFDLFNFSNGAASLYCVRVTDGLEESAEITFFDRRPGGGDYLDRDTQTRARRPVLKVTAKSGGRWGGRYSALARDVAFAAATETTLNLGAAMLEDEWAGATLKVRAVTTKTYEVLSNTAAGVLTLASDSTLATDWAAGGSGTRGAFVYLPRETREVNSPGQVAGSVRGLSVRVKAAEDSAGNYFGLEVYRDEELVASWGTLSLDPANKYFVESIINDDPDNPWITAESLFTGTYSDTTARPASFAGEFGVGSSVSGVAAIQVMKSTVSTYATPGSDLGTAVLPTIPALAQRCTLRCTFSNATTFAVTAVDGPLEVGASSFGAGTVGTAWAPPTHADDHVPGFTIVAGPDAFASGDVLDVSFEPLPVDPETGVGLLAGKWFYPSSASEERVLINSNTPTAISLRTALSSAPTANSQPVAVETEITDAVTFPTSAATQALSIMTGHLGLVEVEAASSAYASIAALCAALNTAWQSATGESGDPFIPGTTTSGAVAIDSREIKFPTSQAGADAFWQSVPGSGTNDLDGLVVAAQDVGARSSTWIVEATSEMWGGYDGADPDDADYIAAYNTATSLINRLRGQNVGLIKIATPGVTSTAVQKAGIAYAEAINGQYRIEVPANVTSETSAKTYVNGTIGRNDHAVGLWPSYGYVTNPLGGGLVLQSLTGAVMGREAKVARDFNGYHKAAAGQDVTLPHVIKDVLDGAPINEELLNPVGLQVLKRLKGSFVVWGDRTLASDPGWMWKHQRELMSHYERQLEENFDWIVFAINDPATESLALAALRAFFLPEWQKRALRGATFEEACSIKVDGENNTNLTRAAGDLNADVSLRLADTVERFIISIGKKGIFDQAA